MIYVMNKHGRIRSKYVLKLTVLNMQSILEYFRPGKLWTNNRDTNRLKIKFAHTCQNAEFCIISHFLSVFVHLT